MEPLYCMEFKPSSGDGGRKGVGERARPRWRNAAFGKGQFVRAEPQAARQALRKTDFRFDRTGAIGRHAGQDGIWNRKRHRKPGQLVFRVLRDFGAARPLDQHRILQEIDIEHMVRLPNGKMALVVGVFVERHAHAAHFNLLRNRMFPHLRAIDRQCRPAHASENRCACRKRQQFL